MQISLILPSTSPLSIISSFSYHRNYIEKPLFSSLKVICNNIPKNKIEYSPNIFGTCFNSPAISHISKSCLAANFDYSTANAVETDDDHQKSTDHEIELPGDLRRELMPKHLAVIMDGQGRWAKNRGLPIEHAHYTGIEKLKQLILNSRKFGIKVLTVFMFSTENWNRPKEEVDFLMAHFEGFIQSFIKEQVMKQDMRFTVIGDKSRLPESAQSTISSVEESAKSNRGMHFLMALSYGGRHDITSACKKIASKVEDGILRANDINESVFEQHLLTNVTKYPNPDLMIRTSGELRVSNFLLWQLAYTEFYFADKLFPDFEEPHLIEALISFQQRQRRFGGRNK